MSGARIALADSSNSRVATTAEPRGRSAIQASKFNQRCLIVRRICFRVYLSQIVGVVAL